MYELLVERGASRPLSSVGIDDGDIPSSQSSSHRKFLKILYVFRCTRCKRINI